MTLPVTRTSAPQPIAAVGVAVMLGLLGDGILSYYQVRKVRRSRKLGPGALGPTSGFPTQAQAAVSKAGAGGPGTYVGFSDAGPKWVRPGSRCGAARLRRGSWPRRAQAPSGAVARCVPRRRLRGFCGVRGLVGPCGGRCGGPAGPLRCPPSGFGPPACGGRLSAPPPSGSGLWRAGWCCGLRRRCAGLGLPPPGRARRAAARAPRRPGPWPACGRAAPGAGACSWGSGSGRCGPPGGAPALFLALPPSAARLSAGPPRSAPPALRAVGVGPAARPRSSHPPGLAGPAGPAFPPRPGGCRLPRALS